MPEELWAADDQALGTHIAALCATALTQQGPCDFIQRYFARLGRVALAPEQLREIAVIARQAYARWRADSANVAEWMK